MIYRTNTSAPAGNGRLTTRAAHRRRVEGCRRRRLCTGASAPRRPRCALLVPPFTRFAEHFGVDDHTAAEAVRIVRFLKCGETEPVTINAYRSLAVHLFDYFLGISPVWVCGTLLITERGGGMRRFLQSGWVVCARWFRGCRRASLGRCCRPAGRTGSRAGLSGGRGAARQDAVERAEWDRLRPAARHPAAPVRRVVPSGDQVPGKPAMSGAG